MWKLAQFSCVYYPHQAYEIQQVLSYSVDIKAPRELWNPLSKTALSRCSFIWNKGPVTSEMTLKLKNNF